MTPTTVLKFALGPLGIGVLGAISLPITSWFFAPEDIGMLAMLQVVIGLGIMIGSLGLDQAYVREYHLASDKVRLFVMCFFPGLFVVLAFLIGVVFFSPNYFAQALYSHPSPVLAYLTLACMILAFVQRYLSIYLRVKEKALQFSFSQLLPKFVFLVLVIALPFYYGLANIYVLMGAQLAGLCSVLIVFFFLVKGGVKFKFDLAGVRPAFRALLSFGMPLILAGVAAWGLRATDKVMLKNLSGLSELGVYAVAATISNGASIVVSVFNTVWAPVVYKWEANGEMASNVELSCRLIQFVVYFLFVMTGLFSWLFEYILPPKYQQVEYLLAVCLAPPLLYALSEVSSIGINLARKTSYSVYATLVALIISIGCNLWLIPIFGASGAAISTSLAFYFYLVFRTELAVKIWRPVRRRRMYSMTFLVLALSWVGALWGRELPLRIEVFWLVCAAVGLFVYWPEIKFSFSALSRRRLRSGREA